MASTSGYPVQLDIHSPLEVAKWRPLVHWILGIPHFVLLYVLQIVLAALGLVSWFAILFTDNIPRGLFDFMTRILRYQWRVYVGIVGFFAVLFTGRWPEGVRALDA